MGYVVAGLYLICILAVRRVFYHWGVPVSVDILRPVGHLVAFCLLVGGAYTLIQKRGCDKLYDKAHRAKVQLWFCSLPILFLYGLLYGNDWKYVGMEAIGFCYMGIFLLLCGDDRILERLEKPLTVLFYIGVVLNGLYYQTATVHLGGEEGFSRVADISGRYTNSLGASCRPLLGVGLFLGARGLTRRSGGRWKYMQALALVAYFACEVGLYQFRSSAIAVLLVLLMSVFVRPVVDRRVQGGWVVVCVAIASVGAVHYSSTESFTKVQRRFWSETSQEPLLASRSAEFECMLRDMGWQVGIGRGLGGAFDASDIFRAESGSSRWTTVHFGSALLLLKGGVLFFLLFVSMLRPCFSAQRRSWYRSPYSLTAFILIPAYLMRLFLVPLAPWPEMILVYFPGMFVISRCALVSAPRTAGRRSIRGHWRPIPMGLQA